MQGPPSSGHWVYDPFDFRGVKWFEQYSAAVSEVYRRASETSAQGKGEWGPYRYLCATRLKGADMPRARELAKWRWAHGNTLMQPLDPQKLATIIKRTPIRCVGDSLMQEMFSSMVGLIGQHVMSESAWAANGTLVVPLANGGAIRFDSKHQKAVTPSGNHSVDFEPPAYPILVLGSSMPVAKHGCDVRSDLGSAVSQHFHGLLVVYVAMNPTHPGCSLGDSRMGSAYSQPTRAKPAIAHFSKGQLHDYHRWCWNKIPEHTQNDIQSLREALGKRVVVLNMTDATDQRPDSHSIKIPNGLGKSRCCDCMHHCLPGGPIETWNDALFTALTQAELSRN